MEKRTIKSGFTLIELLVVIAIIAMLMAVIMPALKFAKRQASAALCLSNERQIITAWIMYAEDNDSLICGPGTVDTRDPRYHWVGPAETDGGVVIGASDKAGFTAEDEIRGIEKGTMYPYYEDYKAVHCPSDKRSKRNPACLQPPYGPAPHYGGEGGYRTYSFVYNLGTWLKDDATDGDWVIVRDVVNKTTDIQNPSSSFALVEENDNRNYNWGAWAMNIQEPSFVDPFAVFHNGRSILAFADGHAEKIVWQDADTVRHSQEITDGRFPFVFKDPGNVDLDWLMRHYPKK